MRKTGKEVNCKVCDKMFYVSAWRLKIGKGKCCSSNCYHQTQVGSKPWNFGKQYLAILGSKNYNWKGGKVHFTCAQCHKQFSVWQYRARFNPKYCSRKCSDDSKVGVKHSLEHRLKMSEGLKRNLPRTVFRKGQRPSIKTEFKKGLIPWSKGKKLSYITGELNNNWKGNKVGYFALHNWVKRHKGKASICIRCNSTGKIQWANIDHKYKRRLEDYIALCVRCHTKYDRTVNNKRIPNRNEKGIFIAGHT